MKKPLVYISSPYTKGDQLVNARYQCFIWNRLRSEGVVTPIAPLWSAFQHFIDPVNYQGWMEYDIEIVSRCDALVRCDVVHQWEDGSVYTQRESRGADMEWDHAIEIGIPTFIDINSLYRWANGEYQDG